MMVTAPEVIPLLAGYVKTSRVSHLPVALSATTHWELILPFYLECPPSYSALPFKNQPELHSQERSKVFEAGIVFSSIHNSFHPPDGKISPPFVLAVL